jgi:hypothetical protein
MSAAADFRAQIPSSTDPGYLERMADAAANYDAALAAIRLIGLLTAARWASAEDCFDLVLAAGLMRRAA